MAKELNLKISNSKLVIFEQGGHGLYREVPDQFNQVVLDFVDSIKIKWKLNLVLTPMLQKPEGKQQGKIDLILRVHRWGYLHFYKSCGSIHILNLGKFVILYDIITLYKDCSAYYLDNSVIVRL